MGVSLAEHAGLEVVGLPLAVTCPVCGGIVRLVNGVVREVPATDKRHSSRFGELVGTEAVVVVGCPDHGEWEVHAWLRRADR